MLCHDPRISNDRSEKVETDNPALILAEQQRRADFIPDWELIALQADECDELVDITTFKPVYPDVERLWPQKKR